MNVRKSTDLRFLKKILTDDEISLVKESDVPDAALWSIWACKEAAYKVVRKMTGGAAFIPRRWSVLWVDASGGGRCVAPPAAGFAETERQSATMSGFVMIPDFSEIPFCLHVTHMYVHSIASDTCRALGAAKWQVDTLPPEMAEETSAPSSFVRQCLIGYLAEMLGLDRREIEVIRPVKTGLPEPPLVYLNGCRAAIDISLSHDGDFTAFSFISGDPISALI
jgi:hypothetical protein